MAINPETQYPGKIAPGDANYPYGGPRNVTVPGDGTGTPWEAALVSDIFGFQQALLTAAAVVPSGSPETAVASQYLQSLQRIAPLPWVTGTSYLAGAQVKGSDGHFYKAVVTNSGNDPIADDQTNWIPVQKVIAGVGSPNIIGGFPGNTIASGTTSRANTISGGGFTGNINRIDGDETRYATIGGGYDNYIDGVSSTETLDAASSTISGGAHNLIKSTHATVTGGSFNDINIEAEYSVIDGGTLNKIEDNCAYAIIAGGDQNQLKNGGTTEDSGFRAAIVGGLLNVSWGRNSGIFAGASNLIEKAAHYSYIFGNNNQVGNATGGLNSFAIGDGNNVNTTAGNLCGAMGLNNNVDGTNSYAFGRSHLIDNHTYSTARGNGATVPHPSSHVHTGRNSSVGNGSNQSLEYNVSQETTGAVLANLSLTGSSSWPVMPENSVVDGVINLSGVDVATGDTYSSEIQFTVKRIGAANPTIVHQANVVKGAEITPAATPTITTTTSGRYRLGVTGEAGKTVNWNAAARGHQTVYA